MERGAPGRRASRTYGKGRRCVMKRSMTWLADPMLHLAGLAAIIALVALM